MVSAADNDLKSVVWAERGVTTRRLCVHLHPEGRRDELFPPRSDPVTSTRIQISQILTPRTFGVNQSMYTESVSAAVTRPDTRLLFIIIIIIIVVTTGSSDAD